MRYSMRLELKSEYGSTPLSIILSSKEDKSWILNEDILFDLHVWSFR